MGIFFVTGVHGVGKTTICQKAAIEMQVPYFSASSLIHSQDATALGVSKLVNDPDYNQNILIIAAKKVVSRHKFILLDGHTTLLTDDGVSRIPIKVFHELDINCIVALFRKPQDIDAFLASRDGVTIGAKAIAMHQDEEVEYAKIVSKTLNVPFWLQKEPEAGQIQILIASWLKREGEWDARRQRNAGKEIF